MLLSHPDKTLQQHILEVSHAAMAILAEHSAKIKGSCLPNWVAMAVAFHDVGKGTVAFQQYIRNPTDFVGSQKSKSHVPLSFLAVLAHGKKKKWGHEQLLAVANAVLGHHSKFKNRYQFSNYLWDLNWGQTLARQTVGVDWNVVAESVGVPFEPVIASEAFLQEVGEWIDEDIFQEWIDGLPIEEGIRVRLQSQFVYSVLLEADKAFLRISEPERSLYRTAQFRTFALSSIEHFTETKMVTPLTSLRRNAVHDLQQSLPHFDNAIQSMTLPTGIGKTMLAARWAFYHRERWSRNGSAPRIIIVLPFLSVIDQTHREYQNMLSGSGLRIVPYHSLSERHRDDTENEEVAEFLLDTWHGDVVITTFDQFLLAAFDSHSKNQMRFHNLCDALVVIDEVQALPTALWDLLGHTLKGLAGLGEFRVLAMSATQPGYLSDATELIMDHKVYYESLDRYELLLRHETDIRFEDFLEEIADRANSWQEERVMIVLNTRRSARHLRDTLDKRGKKVIFISADLTPKDRLAAIDAIKRGTPCLVVATQCVEAGVDIDVQLVIRDFGPFDSIVQVAGRCNRNGTLPGCHVEIVSLVDEVGRRFSSYVYDEILLQETRTALRESVVNPLGKSTISERQILALTNQYFHGVSDKKDAGSRYTRLYATWDEQFPDPLELLRGKKQKQIHFIVWEQAPQIPDELEHIHRLPDLWERKRALRKIAPQIASVTVSVYASSEWDPSRFADLDATGNFHLLRLGYYSAERGLDLDDPNVDDEQEPASWGLMF